MGLVLRNVLGRAENLTVSGQLASEDLTQASRENSSEYAVNYTQPKPAGLPCVVGSGVRGQGSGSRV